MPALPIEEKLEEKGALFQSFVSLLPRRQQAVPEANWPSREVMSLEEFQETLQASLEPCPGRND